MRGTADTIVKHFHLHANKLYAGRTSKTRKSMSRIVSGIYPLGFKYLCLPSKAQSTCRWMHGIQAGYSQSRPRNKSQGRKTNWPHFLTP